ncbi:hypothetical protein KA005_27615, partial [bacterium]|nr:hypothetical protein [bacterium]
MNKNEVDKKELAQQTKLAFDFIHKLHLETSYLVKEIEGLLYEEDEHFVIGCPSGYHISSRSSSGLEARLIQFWMMRSFSVFFVEEEKTKKKGGQTITNIADDPSVIFLRIVLENPELKQPVINIGVLSGFTEVHKDIRKIEKVIGRFGYTEDRIFVNLPNINYTDSYVSFKGQLKT